MPQLTIKVSITPEQARQVRASQGAALAFIEEEAEIGHRTPHQSSLLFEALARVATILETGPEPEFIHTTE